MRILAVGHVFAAYQMMGIYPFEVFTHKLGHKLICSKRLPEAVYLYATKGECKKFEHLLFALGKIMPLASVKIHRQCVIGIVILEEISLRQAAIIAPHIPILDQHSQILHITKRVVWQQPFPVKTVARFDKWVPLSLAVQSDLRRHAAQMASPSIPDVSDPPELDMEEFECLEEEPPSSLLKHARSTPQAELYGPTTVVRAEPEVLNFFGCFFFCVPSL